MPKALKRTLQALLVLLVVCLTLGTLGGAMWLSDAIHERTYVDKDIPNYDPTKPIPAEALREDFGIIRGAIENEHGAPYLYTSKEELSAMFDAAYAKLNKPMSEVEFVKLVGPIIHAVHDGHTNLSLPDDFKYRYIFEENVGVFPLVSYFEKDRVRVWSDGTPEGSVPRGSEILAVDGEPTEKLVRRVIDLFVSTDGYTYGVARETLSYRGYLNYRFLTYLAYLKGLPETYEVTLRTPQGDEETVQIESVNIDHLADVISARYANPLAEEVADEGGEGNEAATHLRWEGDVPILNVDSFDEATFDEYAEAVEIAFTEIHERGARNLVLDLRENGGGEASRAPLIFRYLGKENILVNTSFEARTLQTKYAKYTEGPWSNRITNYLYALFLMKRDNERGLWVARDAALTTERNTGNPPFLTWPELTLPPFEGHIFMLISGQTFSSGGDFAALIDVYHKPLTIIGRETSGSATTLVASLFSNLILPNTRLEVRVSLVRLDLAGAEGLEKGRGVIPDVEVWPTFEDVVEGRDRVLETALNLIEQERRDAAN